MEAAAEGTSGGERWPDGGEDTDELSGLRESTRQEERWGQIHCFFIVWYRVWYLWGIFVHVVTPHIAMDLSYFAFTWCRTYV